METKAENKSKGKLIHIGRILSHGTVRYLLLRKKDPHTFAWFTEIDNGEEAEEPTPGDAPHFEEAMRLARLHWKSHSFRTVNCGFRYTLPERDEHGINALFYQMAASYSSPNGVYFDEELGNNCFVNFASQEARDIWQRLKIQGRL